MHTITFTALLEGCATFEGREIDGIKMTYSVVWPNGTDLSELMANTIVKDPFYKRFFTSYHILEIRADN